MTTNAWIRIAGMLVAIAVVAVALVAVPLDSWTTPSIVSLVLLALAAGFAFWAPALYPPAPDGDATRIAFIGPLFVQALLLIALSAWSLAVARNHGATSTVWTLDVLYVAVLIVGTVLLKASSNVIESAAARSRAISAAPKPSDEKW